MSTGASGILEKIEQEQAKVIEIPLGQIPITALPKFIQHFVNETRDKLNFPPDYTIAGILTAVSIALGNTYGLKVRNGWIEFANIFLALVGSPGVNKSHPLTQAMKPLHKLDVKNYLLHKEAVKEHEVKKRQAIKDSTEIPDTPKRNQRLLNDTTLEALFSTLENNPRGVAVVVDELAMFLKNMNKYNSGSDVEAWLSLFSGKSVGINRKGGGSILIENPFVSLCGTIQPAILKEMGVDGKAHNGFVDRFLFAYPKHSTRPHFNQNEVDQQIFVDYENVINRLLALDFKQYEGQSIPNILTFNNEALQVFIEWSRKNTDLINETENDNQKGVYSKLENYVLRLALIMQMLFWACKEADLEHIEVNAINSAIKFIEYFRVTSNRAASLISPSSPFTKLSALQIKVLSALPAKFTTGEGLEIIKTIEVDGNVMAERVFKKFLNKEDLFRKITHAQYEKI